jgi:uncharacterized protein (DUF58 family)
MLAPRGVTVALAGAAMWLTARLLGSAGLEVVAIGLLIVPFVASTFLRIGKRHLDVRRRLSDARVAPGTRITVRLDVENRSTARTPLLLLEDRLPPALGRPARLVVTGVAGRTSQEVSYTLLPQARGRYTIGPLTIDVTDAFGLTRQRLRVDRRDELLVMPELEDLRVPPDSKSHASVGTARARQLLRSGEEYYTLRGFQEGDDLRRIHWRSVARTGELMIRQDEASRRATGLVFIDNREAALGRSHGPAFERAASCAASVGLLLYRAGFSLRIGTADTSARAVSEEGFMDALAHLTHGRGPSLAPSLTNLRASATADSSLVFVAACPAPQEIPALIRAGAGFGPKLAILIHRVDPHTAPAGQRDELSARATQASLGLTRAGWDCLVLSPSMKLSERWHIPRERPLASNA